MTGCKRSITMGHGDYAVCGELYYGNVTYYCAECLAKRVRQLEDLIAESAPIAWVANEDFGEAEEWEIKASLILKEGK